MHRNQETLNTFYRAFTALKPDGMDACYAAAVTFRDEVFTLKGKEVGAMWHMLCSAAQDFSLTFSDVEADEARGSANWMAQYKFSRTGRMVTNRIHADFEFRDGLILRHRDTFDLHRWMGMALGPVGTLLGWLPPMRAKVRATASAGLAKFIAAHPEYQAPPA